MASHQEHYSLRWNNHQNHILRAFETLLQTKTLVDVTLVCAETSIRAHKVVLSACSPFFQRVFSETPCKHPVIVLKDFRGWVVQAIVDFMYRGEISVPQERLQVLIQAGESLQVRGLVDHPVTGNTPTPAASPDEFSMVDSMDTHTFQDTNLVNSTTIQQKLLFQQSLSDTQSKISSNPQHSYNELCTSPMPRRKQARPRRRSGENAPHDLSSKPTTPIPPSQLSPTLNTNVSPPTVNNSSSISKNPVSTTNSPITPKKEQPDASPKNLVNDEVEEDEDEIGEDHMEPPESFLDDDDMDEEEDIDNEHENEIDKNENSELPENLCTKQEQELNLAENLSSTSNTSASQNNSSISVNSRSNSINDNNNRIVLSLKDFRHLNKPSSQHHQHRLHLPPPNAHNLNILGASSGHPLNLNNHPAHSMDRHNNMKHDGPSHENRQLVERESPFLDQMDLSIAHHNLMHGDHPMDHLTGMTSKEFKDSFKDFKDFASSPISLPPHFGQQDGHHPNSPLNFPHLPSVSALALTPPHSKYRELIILQKLGIFFIPSLIFSNIFWFYFSLTIQILIILIFA